MFRTNATPRTEVQLEVAVAALLVDAARADGVYDEDERRAVLRLLREMFGVSEVEARALHDQGDAAQNEAADVVRFTRVIKMALSEAERITFIEALWHVVLVDHERDPHENALMRHLVPLVGISDYDSATARHRVMAQLNQSNE